MFPFGCVRDGRVKITVSWSQIDYKVPRRREVYQLLFPTTEVILL
jgi:hypothetical protein